MPRKYPAEVRHQVIEPLAVRFGGDHLTREPLEHLEA
jgi:hypothetical protein